MSDDLDEQVEEKIRQTASAVINVPDLITQLTGHVGELTQKVMLEKGKIPEGHQNLINQTTAIVNNLKDLTVFLQDYASILVTYQNMRMTKELAIYNKRLYGLPPF